MIEPLRTSDEFPKNQQNPREKEAQQTRPLPNPSETHGKPPTPQEETLGEAIRARTIHPHKGDVGRPGTNEDIFQGSKVPELEPARESDE